MTIKTAEVGTRPRREQPPQVRGRHKERYNSTICAEFRLYWESWNELQSHIKGDWYSWEHTTLARLSQGIVAPILH